MICMMLKQESLELDAEPTRIISGELSMKKPAHNNAINSAVKSRFELDNDSIALTDSSLSFSMKSIKPRTVGINSHVKYSPHFWKAHGGS